VVTEGGMKEALDSYGAVRGYRVAVSEVDMSKAAETVEWKGIFYIKFARAVYA